MQATTEGYEGSFKKVQAGLRPVRKCRICSDEGLFVGCQDTLSYCNVHGVGSNLRLGQT
jgi:hypothetical protein